MIKGRPLLSELGGVFSLSAQAICTATDTCANSMTYVAWSGSQVLLEERRRLDFTTTDSAYYGVVSYTHAGGTDQPLSV